MSAQSQMVPQKILTGMIPCEGPKTIPILIDFSLGNTFTADLSVIQNLAFITCVETVFIDNSQNTAPLKVSTSPNTKQDLYIPAGAQAYLPILQTNPAVLTFFTTTALKIMVQLLNFYVPPFVWNTGSGGFVFSGSNLLVQDTILESMISNGFGNVRTFPGDIGLTDRSGTIAVGGTVQSLAIANPTRNRFIVHNPSTATEVLQICFGVSTAGRINLVAGQTWDESGSTCFNGGIFVVAATAAHAFTAYEG